AHVGRAHAALLAALFRRRLPDALVGPLGADGQEVRGLVEIAVEAERPRRVRVCRDVEEAAEGVDRDAARDLTGFVAAHAVAAERSGVRGQEEQRVLVVIALAADVGRAGEVEGHGGAAYTDAVRCPLVVRFLAFVITGRRKSWSRATRKKAATGARRLHPRASR